MDFKVKLNRKRRVNSQIGAHEHTVFDDGQVQVKWKAICSLICQFQ